MDFKTYIETFSDENEKPLDRMVTDGGMCSIFRTIGCIGDSLSSGEFESYSPDGVTGYHDLYEDSWGQFIARAAKSAAVRLPVPSGPANSCAWTMRPVFTGRMICSVRNLRARNSENELGSGIRTS